MSRTYLSIDIEASGPTPGDYYMASFAAVPVAKTDGLWRVCEDTTFYSELQPLAGAGEIHQAMRVHGLTREHLRGCEEPENALPRFAGWLRDIGPVTAAAWPTAFDCGFVYWYFWHFTNTCPLGYSGFDIGSFACGLFRKTNIQDVLKPMRRAGWRKPKNPREHHALHDAIEQGETLAWLLNHAARNTG